MARNRRRLPTHAEINITSLVDVAFTLLVIFIITAPILQGGIQVDLPEAESAPITQAEAAIISITRDGTIYLGDVEVAGMDELELLLPRYLADRDAQAVWIRGDSLSAYGTAVSIMGAVNAAGVQSIGIVAEPESGRRRP